MTVYIDENCRCHAQNAPGRRAVEVPALEGKCRRFIEGYRYVPAGESWVRADGKVFQGEMLAPHEDYSRLQAAQQVYEELSPKIQEFKEKMEALAECIDGLATNPSFEQLIDCISMFRELLDE